MFVWCDSLNEIGEVNFVFLYPGKLLIRTKHYLGVLFAVFDWIDFLSNRGFDNSASILKTLNLDSS